LELKGLALCAGIVAQPLDGDLVEKTYFKQYIVEAPSLGSQDGWHANLAFLDKESNVDRARAGVASCPRFAWAGVGRMPIGTQRLSVGPSVRYRIYSLLAG
jgi:hypothetical protein